MSASGHKRHIAALCLLFGIVCGQADAADLRNLQVERIGTTQGLSQSHAYAIAQDHQGYIWIGTQEGLNRYNGQRMELFHRSLSGAGATNENGLTQDWIWDLVVDHDGILWIATEGGGLNLFEPATQSFRAMRHDPGDLTSLSSDRVRSLYQDRKGDLWVGTTDAGLNHVDTSTGRVTRIGEASAAGAGELATLTVTSIAEDATGRLWVGTDGDGAYILDSAARTFSRVPGPEVPGGLSDSSIRSIYLDPMGRLWIATFAGGLNLYEPTLDTFTVYNRSNTVQPDGTPGLRTNLIRDVLMDQRGTLWLATDQGLAEWRGGNRFVHYEHDRAELTTLSTNPLLSLFQDKGGNLWIGSYAGVNKWNYVSDAFTYYDLGSGHVGSDIVSAINVDAHGWIWIGTYGAGIASVSPDGRAGKRFTHDAKDPGSLSDDRVMSLEVTTDGTVWAGTRNGGLNALAPGADHFVHYRAEDKHSISHNGVSALFEDSEKSLWIGTYGGGLNRLRNGVFERYQHDPSDARSISSNLVVALHQDRRGQMWIGTEDGGLNQFSYGTADFQRFEKHLPPPQYFPSRSAWDISESHDGTLWIGTRADGLVRWGRAGSQPADAPPKFQTFTKAHGLLSDTVLAAQEDVHGRLWISTNKGLLQFDPDSGAMRQYDNQYGLRDNEFHQGVKAQLPDGSLLFGGNRGALRFNPDTIQRQAAPPPIALEAKSRQGTIHRAYDSDSAVGTIELHYPDYAIGFEFAALDYASPDKNQFRYRLSGFDEEWINPGDYPRANYTNLPPGEYRFTVQAANNFGHWNLTGATVRVLVVPPPWKSPAAYALYALGAFALVAVAVGTNRRKLAVAAEHQQHLESQVTERTIELARQNRQLEALNEKLRIASLTDPLTGLHNRRYFYEVIDTLVAQTDRIYSAPKSSGAQDNTHEHSLFIMMIDLDGFKHINDTYGHQAGDLALQQITNLLTSCSRESDIVCRWGGDEFILAGQSARRSEVDRIAERIRHAIANHDFDTGTGETACLSASIGLTHYPLSPAHPGAATWQQVADLADRAAYLAKAHGKNAWVRISATGPVDLHSIPSGEEDVLRMIDEQHLEVVASNEATRS